MADIVDYTEPIRGMAAMRMRILRAELQEGFTMSVYNTLIGGCQVCAGNGAGGHTRTTSTGALISLSLAAEQNSTYARAIRGGGRIIRARDGPNNPLRPDERMRLHPRSRPVARARILSRIDRRIDETTCGYASGF